MHSEQLAQHLNAPQSDNRNAAIDKIWDAMIQFRPTHNTILEALGPWHAAIDHRNPDYTGQIVRRDLIRAAGRRSFLWNEVAEMIEKQKETFYAPLIDPAPNLIMRPMDGLLTDLMHGLHGSANPNHRKKAKSRATEHADIPLSGDEFINLMRASYRIAQAMALPRPRSFLDVGCGGGSRSFAAASFFEIADGLEYDPDYYAASKELFRRVNPIRCTAIEGDALQFDDYSSYQIIYFYRPMTKDAMLVDLENRILSQAAPGTIIVAPRSQTLHWGNAAKAPVVCKNIHLAHVSEAKAAEVRAKAESIGPDWVIDLQSLESSAGFWAPILQVSHQNGFCSG
jgi:protein-L-isoaspartate O-methyltransferase